MYIGKEIDQAVRKSIAAEKFQLNSVWICPRPNDLYPTILATRIASNTERIRIGICFPPIFTATQQISKDISTLINSYGKRFEICLLPGDEEQLRG